MSLSSHCRLTLNHVAIVKNQPRPMNETDEQLSATMEALTANEGLTVAQTMPLEAVVSEMPIDTVGPTCKQSKLFKTPLYLL